VAQVIYPKGRGCTKLCAEKCETDYEVGLSFEPVLPDPDGMRQREPILIQVDMFDYNSEHLYHESQALTIKQAQQVGEWLCKRARETRRSECLSRLRQMLRFGL
jgi:hypothetical protein